MPRPGDVVATRHGPGRVTHVHARIMEPAGAIGYLVTVKLEAPVRLDGGWCRRVEHVEPIA